MAYRNIEHVQRTAARVVGLCYPAPMGVFEITMGLWLLIRGLPAQVHSPGESQ